MSWPCRHLIVIQLRLPTACIAQAPLQSLQLWVVCILGPTGCHPSCLHKQKTPDSLQQAITAQPSHAQGVHVSCSEA